MNRSASKVAREYGKHLPQFENLREAKKVLFSKRDEDLALLRKLSLDRKAFAFDKSPESLKVLESLHNDLVHSEGFASIGLTKEQFRAALASYYYAVVVANNPKAKWVVREHVFTPGRYEIGVDDGQLSLMGPRVNYSVNRKNSGQYPLSKEYNRYFGQKRLPGCSP